MSPCTICCFLFYQIGIENNLFITRDVVHGEQYLQMLNMTLLSMHILSV